MQEIEQHPTTFRIQTFCPDEANMSLRKFHKNRVVHSNEDLRYSELSQIVDVHSGNSTNSEEHAFLFGHENLKDYIVWHVGILLDRMAFRYSKTSDLRYAQEPGSNRKHQLEPQLAIRQYMT